MRDRNGYKNSRYSLAKAPDIRLHIISRYHPQRPVVHEHAHRMSG